jgi:hypothetical protein
MHESPFDFVAFPLLGDVMIHGQNRIINLMLGGVCEYFGIRALVHADITGADEFDD